MTLGDPVGDVITDITFSAPDGVSGDVFQIEVLVEGDFERDDRLPFGRFFAGDDSDFLQYVDENGIPTEPVRDFDAVANTQTFSANFPSTKGPAAR